ncbi:MAG: NADH-quinone oxidoreductase subunit C [Candidatus Brockarchaeota archaeon]|nr:NADH-quinone oxidoreductase subunit C [Candidatus Brockarchaeota archaeon]
MSAEEEAMEAISKRLGERAQECRIAAPRRICVLVRCGSHRDAISALLERFEFTTISTITGVDLGEDIELNYHLWCGRTEVTVKTRLPKIRPDVETVTDILPGAALYEREAFELLGVRFLGHPGLKRLVLPDSWPEGQYPLRRDWKPEIAGLEFPQEADSVAIGAEGENRGSTVNVVFGPQHPALHEPERFLFKLDGEIVVDVEPRLGYAHRGIEKGAEKLMFFQATHLIERICGICNVAHATCFCQAVESLGGIEVPPRASYLRTIVHELNRLHSHLLLLGVAGMEIGFETLFQYSWRDREMVLDLTEKATGNRIMAEYNAIGGVRRDLDPIVGEEMKKVLSGIKRRAAFYKKLLGEDPTFGLRTRGIGVLKAAEALRLSVVGPVARGSGIKMDVRRHDPYAAYGEIPFEEVAYGEGDSWARFMVRLDEIAQSVDIVNYAIEKLPSGPYRARVPRRVPEGEALGRVEAPRGELVHYVKSDGTAYPQRVKVRSPTLANIMSFREMIRGCYVADIPAVLASLDPCFSCTDRMAFLDVKSGMKWFWSLEEIKRRRLGKP